MFLEHSDGQLLGTLYEFGPRTGARDLTEIGDGTGGFQADTKGYSFCSCSLVVDDRSTTRTKRKDFADKSTKPSRHHTGDQVRDTPLGAGIVEWQWQLPDSSVPAGSVDMASLADVAVLAGVSISTASRVLGSSTHPVAPGTRERVEEAAQSLDFEPNLLARGLVRQRTQTVGVLVHDVMDEYFNEIARGIEDVAYANGYAAFICNSDRDPAKELHYLRKLRAMRVDAILFTAGGINDAEHLGQVHRQLELIEGGGSVIIRLAPHPKHKPDIVYSNGVGLRLAVDHLYSLGHRRIGFLSGPPLLTTSGERRAAYRRALQLRGVQPDPGLVFDGDFTRTGGEAAARRFVSAGLPATAVIGANDQMAIGFLRGLTVRGVKVPDDVSIVGFDDVASCSLVEPQLTTVRVSLYELGAEGMILAMKLLKGVERPARKQLPLNLVVRGSTAKPRQAD